MNDSKNCPVCGLDSKDATVEVGSSYLSGYYVYLVDCKRCGKFTILCRKSLKECEPDYKLSAWIRDCNERKIEIPSLTQEAVDRIRKSLPAYNTLEKQQKLLRNIMLKSKFPGDRVFLSSTYDLPLAWAVSEIEFNYYIDSLEERRLITKDMDSKGDGDVIISAGGWEYLEKHSTDLEEKTQAFVAISFSDKMMPFWENSIKQAIKDAGYTPYRIDVEPHSDRIDVKIMSEIKNSRFIVADVTEQKHGVYFEAGFALGLGLPVIWCVKKEDFGNVHFDTRQYNHIVWESEKELKDQLYNFICVIIGKRRVAAT